MLPMIFESHQKPEIDTGNDGLRNSTQSSFEGWQKRLRRNAKETHPRVDQQERSQRR
jgi:hypothetical protein